MQPTLQDNQLMSKHRVLSFKPQLRLEWRGQDGQNETEQSDHSASLGDSITSSTWIRFSVHTARRASGIRIGAGLLPHSAPTPNIRSVHQCRTHADILEVCKKRLRDFLIDNPDRVWSIGSRDRPSVIA